MTYPESVRGLKAAVLRPLMEPLALFVALMLTMATMCYAVLPSYGAPLVLRATPDLTTTVALIFAAMGIVAGLWWLHGNWIGNSRAFADRHVFPFTVAADAESQALEALLAAYMHAGRDLGQSLERVSTRATTTYGRWRCSQLRARLDAGVDPEIVLRALRHRKEVE